MTHSGSLPARRRAGKVGQSEKRAGVSQMHAGVRWPEIRRALWDWLLPPHCLVCAAALMASPPICAACRADLPRNPWACVRCGLPLPAGDAGRACGRCLRRPPPQSGCVVPFVYADPVDRLLTALKFGGDLAAGRLLGELLVDALGHGALRAQTDLLVPLPLHRQRLRDRGYNQVQELLRPLAAHWRLPQRHDLLRRQRATAPQSDLNAGQRRKNLRGAFAVVGDVRGARVLLVDDVITTGTTVAEAARLLQAAGAAEVRVLAVARVPKRSAG